MRSIPSLIIPIVLLAGCTSVLGIDGDYVVDTDPPGSGGALIGAGGLTSSGGLPPGGGSVGSGGTLADSSAGASDSGGTTDSGSGCKPGRYEGTFDGSHTVSVVVPIPATVAAASSFSFELRGTGGMLDVASGTMNAGLVAVGAIQGAAGITASLKGTLDCADGTVSGQLTGQTTVLGAATPIAGTWEGTVDASGRFSGTWTEKAPSAPAADAGPGTCVVSGMPPPVLSGCGTWNAQ